MTGLLRCWDEYGLIVGVQTMSRISSEAVGGIRILFVAFLTQSLAHVMSLGEWYVWSTLVRQPKVSSGQIMFPKSRVHKWCQSDIVSVS
jgi:hypothetical protein